MQVNVNTHFDYDSETPDTSYEIPVPPSSELAASSDLPQAGPSTATPDPTLCSNCVLVPRRNSRGLCDGCDKYQKRTGRPRPQSSVCFFSSFDPEIIQSTLDYTRRSRKLHLSALLPSLNQTRRGRGRPCAYSGHAISITEFV